MTRWQRTSLRTPSRPRKPLKAQSCTSHYADRSCGRPQSRPTGRGCRARTRRRRRRRRRRHRRRSSSTFRRLGRPACARPPQAREDRLVPGRKWALPRRRGERLVHGSRRRQPAARHRRAAEAGEAGDGGTIATVHRGAPASTPLRRLRSRLHSTSFRRRELLRRLLKLRSNGFWSDTPRRSSRERRLLSRRPSGEW